MPVVTAQNLHKSFGPQLILDGVDLTIRQGERVGLVGINGSGKSTLSKMLAGIEPPDVGEIAFRKSAKVAYLAQEPEFEGNPTAKQAVLEGLGEWAEAYGRYQEASDALAAGTGDLEALLERQTQAVADVERLGGWDMSHRADSVMTHVGVLSPEQRVDTMSGGERRRVALARLLLSQPDLAVLDEPTNHLDVDTIEWLERFLVEEFKGALVLITHDRYVLDRVVTRTLELDRGKLFSFDGGWEDYLQAKAERVAQESRTEASRQNFLRRELDWLRRQPKARTGKQKARIDRAHAAIDAKQSARRENVASLKMETQRLGGTIVEFDGLSLKMGDRTLVRDLTMSLTKGERIGIVGPNGSGKTTLLRTLMGELTPSAGKMVVGKNTAFAYFDQRREGLDDSLSIQENVAGNDKNVHMGGQAIDVHAYLGRFLFSGDKQRQKVAALSGGERARVVLAKLLLKPANVLLLDEPTNDLDVATLGAVEELLLEMHGTALVVTHDRYFLDRIATAILAFEGDGRVVKYEGNYSAYLAVKKAREAEAKKAEAERAAAAKKAAPKSVPASATTAAKKGLTYGERIELDGIMEKIEAAENAVTEIQDQLADPALYVERGDEVPGLQAELARRESDLAAITARWEELELKREG